MPHTREAVRAAAEVIARASYHGKISWDQQPPTIQDVYIERAMPVAEAALAAAEEA